jgi:transcription elongation factor GreA
MKKLFRLTQAGVNELQTEVDALIAKRAGIADAIKSAREQGDLGENAEYQTARAEQERNEARVSEIENILRNVEIIKKPKGARQVQLGSTVKLKGIEGKEGASGAGNGKSGQTKEFQVVGTVEADPLSGKISDESPIGQALLGKAEGDTVEIKTPSDTTTYKIVDIG